MMLEDLPVDPVNGGPWWHAVVATKEAAVAESMSLRPARRAKGEEPPHGTIARYLWKINPCRCAPCRAANSERVAARRAAGYRPPTKPPTKPAAPVRRTGCAHTSTVRYPHPIGTICTSCGKRVA